MPSLMTLEGPRLGADVIPAPKFDVGKAALYALGGAALIGVAYLFTRPRGVLRGPGMLKIIAAESKSADEFARRAEAWNASEREPLSVKKLAAAYKKASPSTVARLIREAHEHRVEGRERLWSKMSRGLRGLFGTKYRVGFLMRGVPDRTEHTFDTIEQATREMRLWKRRGWTAWVEDDAGNRVPVKGAKR